MNRRLFLQWSGASVLTSVVAPIHATGSTAGAHTLEPRPGQQNIVGPKFPATKVWGFNGQVPGTQVRITHGQPVDATVRNSLEVPTAVHWHGIRLPNAMDGVAGLTQAPILPGESFRYQFTPPDAGTYWYHSHVNAYEQVGRGLYGPLIIDERSPPAVDRDLVWMIDDWRLLEDASISNDFGSGHDRSHAGRIGNVPTVNGRFRDIVKVRTGERIRLRLINASNARNFALSFGDLNPSVIAIDGQAVSPFQTSDPIVIGAAGRVDLILDMSGDPGSIMSVADSFYRTSFDLVKFVFEDKPLRESSLSSAISLNPPALPEPDLANAEEHVVTIAGGAMGGLRRAKLDGEWMGLREIARQGYVWAVNEVVGNKLDMPPLIDTPRGRTIKLTLRNETAFPHPMHLHGHHMKLLTIDGQPLSDPRWVDSPLLMPDQTMELAFVADNPGRWLFHCHALEHHAAGLGALVNVS
ncbi:MAG: multicopper oxidase family protein [Gammaproteobacteria bacterium]|nr:multicopper oxidase family protein [Gammaproteobacteria bacterium]